MIFYLFGFTGFIACGEKEPTDSVEEEMDTGVISDTGSDDTGSNDTGSNDTGSDDTGSNDTGSDDTGSDDTGSDDTGSDDTGSETTEGLTCDDVPDCGGDLTGAWSYTGACGETDFANVQQYQEYQLEKCPQIMNFDSNELATGIFTFNEDGNAQNLLTLNVDYSFTWPISDCPLVSGTTNCVDVNSEDVHLPPAHISFDCVDSTTEESCDCTSTHEYTWEIDYAYQTTDNMITLENSDGDLSNFDYCVQEDTLLSVPTENEFGILFTKEE